MEVSLFTRLLGAHEAAITKLTFQYRMHDDVLLLCNTMVYNHQLKSASPLIASHRLELPRLSFALASAKGSFSSSFFCFFFPHPQTTCSGAMTIAEDWLSVACDPSRAVVFLDTSEHKQQATLQNPLEVGIVRALVSTLVASGLATRAIAVMAPFRAQLALLKDSLSLFAGLDIISVLFSSGFVLCLLPYPYTFSQKTFQVDKAQGMDRDCIVISLVRSGEGSIGALLNDWRRVNVAFTRAKKKLILVGNFAMLGVNQGCLSGCLRLIDERGWRTLLPLKPFEYAKFAHLAQEALPDNT